MKIYLLRHTSLNVPKDTFYGQTDLDVSDNFDEEVKDIKKKFLVKKVDLNNLEIFSSPLKRCVKLSEALFNDFKKDIRLKELNFGDWEMKTFNEISRKKIQSWENNLMKFQIPNGESNLQFFDRLKSFCDEVLKNKKDIFIVAHAGSINGIISYISDIPFDTLIKENWKRISYGSLSLIKKEGKKDKFNLEFFGF